MKNLILAAGLLLALAFTGCSKKEDAPPALGMTAILNGQPWGTVASIGPPYAQIDENLNYPTPRNLVDIHAESGTDLTALGMKNCVIAISATYLPKIGRHNINSGITGPIGVPNANANYISIGMQYEDIGGVVYGAFATSGFVEITQVSDTRVAGTFEFMASEFDTSNLTVPSKIFKVEKGEFNAQILPDTTLPIVWNGVQ